jgi:hypothetical protein
MAPCVKKKRQGSQKTAVSRGSPRVPSPREGVGARVQGLISRGRGVRRPGGARSRRRAGRRRGAQTAGVCRAPGWSTPRRADRWRMPRSTGSTRVVSGWRRVRCDVVRADPLRAARHAARATLTPRLKPRPHDIGRPPHDGLRGLLEIRWPAIYFRGAPRVSRDGRAVAGSGALMKFVGQPTNFEEAWPRAGWPGATRRLAGPPHLPRDFRWLAKKNRRRGDGTGVARWRA